MTYEQAQGMLLSLGISLTRMGNQYRINYRSDYLGDTSEREATAKYFDDLGEAFQSGTLMANDVLYGRIPKAPI